MIKKSMLFKECDDGNTQVDEEDAKGGQMRRVTSTTEEEDDESRPRLGKRDGRIDGKEDDPDESFAIDMPSQVPSRGTSGMNEFKKEETSQHYTPPSLPATSSNQPRVTSHGTRNMEEQKLTQSYPNKTAYDRHFQTSSSNQPSHVTSHDTRNMEEQKLTQSYPNKTAYDRHFQTSSSNQPSHVTSHDTRNMEEEKFTQSYPTQQPNKTVTKDTYPYSAGSAYQPSEKSYLESRHDKPILWQPKLQYSPSPSNNSSSSSSRNPYDIFNINNVRITGKVGDITKEQVDVIVSSVDCQMIMGGGLASAILRAGGEVIKQECQKWYIRHIPSTSGKVFNVSSGSLSCKCIMFLVMPDCNVFKSFEENCKIMTRLCKEVLKSLHYIGARSAAIPGLGTGAFNYPLTVFVNGMLTAMQDELSSKSTLKNITLIDQKSYLLTELRKTFGSSVDFGKQGSMV
ncbi:uncharacterized protein [Antedon mediterranea]|uniref:uncharacterized protein n=1 Tax=Antedon mediterranea TaxID=105859 RepID=UPI003AF9EE71